MNGIMNVLKPPGMTSSDVVVFLRRELDIKKVGHTGTLDPSASGVLPICVGKATKISDYIMHQNKIYRCEITLGIGTDTADLDGHVIYKSKDIPGIEDIKRVLKTFVGISYQTPPMYSALKVNGEKLYNLARKGISIDIKPRQIEIFSIDLLEFYSPNRFLVEVMCSKGTYIRSLCRDIGEKLGCGAVMSFLLRTMSGHFMLESSYTLDEIIDASRKGTLGELIIPVDVLLRNLMPIVNLTKDSFKRVINGSSVSIDKITYHDEQLTVGNEYIIYCNNIFLGIGKIYNDNNNQYIKMEKVLIEA